MTTRAVTIASLSLLSRRDRRRLALAALAQMSTSILDLFGVLLVGAVIALGSTSVSGSPPPSWVTQIEDRLGLSAVSTLNLAIALAVLASVLLIGKSAISVLITRRILHFLARRQAEVSARLTSALLSRPLIYVQQRSSHETAYALTTGVLYATLIILGQAIIAATEITLLIVLAVGLMFVSPVVTLFAIAFFAGVAGLIHRLLSGWAGRLGDEVSATQVASYELVQEALRTYREVVVSHRRSNYVRRFAELRSQTALLQADLQMVALIPKYVFEVALVVGAGALALAVTATHSVTQALVTIAVFLAAGSRIVPSILRFQVSTLNIKTAVGQAAPTLQLADELGIADDAEREFDLYAGAVTGPEHPTSGAPATYLDFVPELVVNGVCFTYPGMDAPALRDVSLHARPGHSVAIVGTTGAGKSTLADILLGVLNPDSGTVLCGGLPPQEAVARWPGGLAYVPQEVALVNGTVRENVALGLDPSDVDDGLAWRALDRARLSAFLNDQRAGLETLIGEDGIRLSGGQRQRLGIARALYSDPLLLVLDEATSALDAETENAISETFKDLRGTVTTVTIAHRLATIVKSDEIIYLENGVIEARGTFDEVLEQSEAFRSQARILGLA
jgi:ABC-type multidrug transport system fused ATPase/permease subunit